jgi:phosphoadenosine phosphosulfate reductase
MVSREAIQQLNDSLMDSDPRVILGEVFQRWPDAAISFSGAEDVALIEMAHKIRADVAVFTLDTGRLHPETYRFIERVREHYQLSIEMLLPDADRLREFTNRKGLFSFYQDGHEECCGIRKVAPLQQKLATLDAWITGQRRDQSPARAAVPVVELDSNFSTESHTVVKINPLANWSSEEVWNTLQMFDVPTNELHDRGYISIGCEPCTRAVKPNEHERAGRWWWEQATIKECGLHRGNLSGDDLSGDD